MHRYKRSVRLQQLHRKDVGNPKGITSKPPTGGGELTKITEGASKQPILKNHVDCSGDYNSLENKVFLLTHECNDLRHKLDVKNEMNDCAQTEISALAQIVNSLQSKVFELEDVTYGTLPENLILAGTSFDNPCPTVECEVHGIPTLLERTDEIITYQEYNT